MGLFDKKHCDICGEKIGLLGNRKLEDGNLCKNCAKKLSSWFSDRRKSTVQEIKEQLDWREANKQRAAQFQVSRIFGEDTRLLLDETHQWFAITRATSPVEYNADVLDFSAITGCHPDIVESHTELKYETRDDEGNVVRESYNPPRYEYNYDFYITVSVDTPYFTEMKFKLNKRDVLIPFQPSVTSWSGSIFSLDGHDEPTYDPVYRNYKQTCDEICSLMERLRTNGAGGVMPGGAAGDAFGGAAFAGGAAGTVVSAELSDPAFARVMKDISWQCAQCATPNSGTVTCQHCGSPVNDQRALSLARNIVAAEKLMEATQGGAGVAAGGVPAAAQNWTCAYCGATNQGNFCESCGAKRS